MTRIVATLGGGRVVALCGVLWTSALVLTQCAPQPAAAPGPPKNAWAADMKASLTIRELMEQFIDPTSDFVFDAVVFDATDKGTSQTAPVSDEDWAKVERGAWQLAEGANLLMIPRGAEPAGISEPRKPGEPAPQLSGPEIEAKIDADRAKWNQHADALRVASLKALEMIKTRKADVILEAGSQIDRACESCHLEYWYPGDRKAVEADAAKKVTFDSPTKDGAKK
jgi:hypothetical protein